MDALWTSQFPTFWALARGPYHFLGGKAYQPQLTRSLDVIYKDQMKAHLRLAVLSLPLIFVFSTPALACLAHAWHLADHYPATYRYQILPDDPHRSEVEKSDFLSIPHLVSALFAADYEKAHLKVKATFDWEKPFFTAWAHQHSDNEFSINFWGGMARIPSMTKDAFALVACHEIGHIMGGEPKMKISSFLWATSEGQSDYFATGDCLKRYLKLTTKKDDHLDLEASPSLYTRCRLAFRDDLDFSICLKSGNAALAFGEVLNYLSEEDLGISLEEQSLVSVEETLFNSYPDIQCRVDTLVAGALCSAENFPCEDENNQRPGCWFKN